jgi:exodeoxyribonuclease V alpha subunit
MTLAWPLAEGAVLGDVDVALARVLERRWPGSEPAALRAAALASWAVQQGHSCLDFDVLARDDALRGQLAQDPRLGPLDSAGLREAAARAPFVAAAAGAPAQPLVLDGARLYLARYHAYEREVGAALRARILAPPVAIDAARAGAALDRLFPGSSAAAAHGAAAPPADRQAEACLRASSQPLTVLCGGPGTGKTYTVVRMLALAALLGAAAPTRVALAAPTGKAATRLTQALREGAVGIALDPAHAAWLRLEATTVHRLLGLGPLSIQPRHDAAHPLDLDLLVIDESSMLDLALFAKLLRALPERCRLVLVGDPGQLPAVEGGAVFGALSQDASARARGNVVALSHAHRFGAGGAIAALVEAVRRGDVDAMRAALAGGDAALRWHDGTVGTPREAFAEAVAAGYGRLRAAREPDEALAALDRFRVLCALREGPLGVEGLNGAIEAALGVRRPEHGYYRGRPILVVANDYGLGLYNGDSGVVLGEARRGAALRAWFADRAGGARPIPIGQLPAHDTGYAMTVHKAQGSEFDEVLLALPRTPHALLSREWLYTAVSRARRQLTIVAPFEVLAAALQRPHLSMSGLATRLC